MANKIEGIYHLTQTAPETFAKALQKIVNTLQDNGQEVEVQYSTNYGQEVAGGVIYSALVIGRVSE